MALGRENLGCEMPVTVYRLLQYTMHDVLIAHYGVETADALFREAGLLAGRAFAENVLEKQDTFDAYVAEVQRKLKELKIGILRIEKADVENLRFTLTVSEDLDCSGLPITDETVCVYDEGFIAGLLEHYTGTSFEVLEIDCWATGARTCRFEANAK